MTTDEADALIEQMPFSFIVPHIEFYNNTVSKTYLIADVLGYCLGIQDIENPQGIKTRHYFLAERNADTWSDNLSNILPEDVKCIVTIHLDISLVGNVRVRNNAKCYRTYHFRTEEEMVLAKLCS